MPPLAIIKMKYSFSPEQGSTKCAYGGLEPSAVCSVDVKSTGKDLALTGLPQRMAPLADFLRRKPAQAVRAYGGLFAVASCCRAVCFARLYRVCTSTVGLAAGVADACLLFFCVNLPFLNQWWFAAF